jgi:GTP diphosphokinase / guanosine-3',5'-bis(diphosphate) 3'-diphosphatase
MTSTSVTYNLNAEEEKKLILREYRQLLYLLKDRLKKGDRELIRHAFVKASKAHQHTRRKSGEPYILHPLAVAKIVVQEIGLGVRSSIASLLHDTVEDTEITLDEIKLDYGNEIAKIIDGLTKIAYVEENQNTTQQAENFKKVLLTLVEDPRIVLIKIADRLHNMRTMSSMRKDKQLKISSETSFIYAPLAHRLGLYEIHSELTDLSLKYTEPEVYHEIAVKLSETKADRDRFIKDFIKPIKLQLEKENINCEIYGRAKSISSILNKIRTKHVSFEEVYDLFAIRIIVESAEGKNDKDECWRAYSIVSNIYKAGVGRMRDWLSQPKGNGYEALHNTFMSSNGRWVEVQLRSKRMNEIAEKGIAAHWRYKENFEKEQQQQLNDKNAGRKPKAIPKEVQDRAQNKLDDFLKHLRELMSHVDPNSLEFVQDLKDELFKQEMYVYTPKGDLRVLTVGATALDFAFDIHSELGAKCIGAKVNYKLVPISHELKNGDQVEIITGKNQKPNEGWLKFVVTGKAKNRIRYYLREEKRTFAEEGEVLLNKKMRALGLPVNNNNLQELANYYKLSSILDLHFAIANNNLDLNELRNFKVKSDEIYLDIKKNINVKEINEELQLSKQLPDKGFELILFGESSNKIKYKLANCCNPIQGDDVFGFVTSSEGLKIHRTNCPNAASLLANYGHRVVKAKWANNKQLSFLTAVRITGLDDVGIINKITSVISGELKINMRSMSIESKDGVFEGTVTVFVKSKEELLVMCQSLEALNGINSVIRLEAE